MMMIRLPLTVIFGAIFSIALFWVLWSLISQPINVGDAIEASRIEFSRMRKETQAETKRDQRVERKPPPPVPQQMRMNFSSGSVETHVANLDPTINAQQMGQIQLGVGSDTDVIPLVRIPPEYPRRALQRGIQGWVQVQFTITETGAVKDAKVISAEPEGVFDKAALNSIARWRYNPKVEDGVPVQRVGVQTVIRFVLEGN